MDYSSSDEGGPRAELVPFGLYRVTIAVHLHVFAMHWKVDNSRNRSVESGCSVIEELARVVHNYIWDVGSVDQL